MPHSPEPVAAPAALHQSLADLLTESERLRGDVRAAEEARQRANRINLIVLILLAAFTLLTVGVTVQNFSTAHKVDHTNARIADCITPGGKCYEQNQQRTSAAIGDIVRSQLYTVECARLYPTESGPAFDQKLTQCVAARLARAQQQPVPRPSPTPSPSTSRR